MSIEFIDGFAYENTNASEGDATTIFWWHDPLGSSSQYVTTNPRNDVPNERNLKITSSSTSLKMDHVFNNPTNIITVGMAFYIADNASRAICSLLDGLRSTQGSIKTLYDVDNLHKIQYFLGSNSTAYTSNKGIRSQQWNYLEWQIKIDDSVGYTIVKINEEIFIEEYNIDTKFTSRDDICYLEIGASSPLSSLNNQYDDLYICNASGSDYTGFLGPIIVETLFPTGTGDLNIGFVNSNGDSNNNWSFLDSNIYQTTDYIEGSGDGDINLNLINNLSNQAFDIKCVQHLSSNKKMDPAFNISGIPIVYSEGSFYSGQLFKPSLNKWHLGEYEIYEIDPFTGSGWTYTGINSLQLGNKLIKN